MLENSPGSLEEIVETLTGFDENDIENRFGTDPNTMLATKPIMAARAIAYIVVARDLEEQDVKNPKGKAYNHVMGMTLKQVDAFFPEDAPEADPEQPVTPAGEGDDSAD